jgi:hypothetical protein
MRHDVDHLDVAAAQQPRHLLAARGVGMHDEHAYAARRGATGRRLGGRQHEPTVPVAGEKKVRGS